MGRRSHPLRAAWELYRDGFRNMTWGRPLVWLIVLKFFLLFAVFRVFFFKPVLSGLDEEQKSEAVGKALTRQQQHNTDTLTLK